MNSQTSVVGVHYRVGRKIGEGSFGVIFDGMNLLNNQLIAIKFEPKKSEAPQLRDEYRTYKLLVGNAGIPNVYYFGQEGLHNILVIDLLGPSLEDLFEWCGRRFSVKTVAMTAKQMLSRVQTIHEKNLVYRDIKPDNFLIGRPSSRNANMVYMVDFGMAKYYRDPKTKQHIPYSERKSLSGTARYMSINTHLGREQSRRDDLESLGHVFMYFLRGSLPWQGLKAANNKHKYEKISEKKQSTSISELCAGFPNEFSKYMTYVRSLEFDEEPDYAFLQELFDDVLRANGDTNDGVYDWMLLNDGKGWESSSSHFSVVAMKRRKNYLGLNVVQNDDSRKKNSTLQTQNMRFKSSYGVRGPRNYSSFDALPSKNAPLVRQEQSASKKTIYAHSSRGYDRVRPMYVSQPSNNAVGVNHPNDNSDSEAKGGFFDMICCRCFS
ncbi:serine/threonine protein kinase (CK1 family) Cki2 [Schizosaccharomyces pombe]|uniref:Casein kinase I homolog 2 n=1 Tax=Schizosaccharomyces pombe (strain 972 / ATCC 24843) TaxID=284812 RepID=CKI2_SCHPO|nr:serine/threonine protein kinase Cki2 [Schizosaccharomyces pombe]P40234.2 RecName: Full=Casein kinase I homolog 2 [Schizosaccharomyces pombe 972h-]CAB87367.1 serine/threonine protein kinase Cki2 [Schizosaccharomyces pombe]|eukprot:NP_595380.1 serine/threonine protein kinase Cki2 [Schizosaccharomyces pombe]